MKKFVNTCMFLAALSLVGCKDPNTNPGTDPGTQTQHDVMTYITTADNTMHFDKVGKNFIEGMNMNPEITLTLDPKTRYQVFDGFGAAITGASAYNLMRMPQDARAKLIKETFSVEEGMGYSYVRVPIGGSDFNARSNYDYTCCDMAGIENFSLTSDENDYIIPVLKEILAVNPALKIMGTPWSCPRWMKVADGDCFSNVGGFSMNAAYAGASEVTAVDISERALDEVRQNASLNGFDAKVKTVCGDVFEVLKNCRKEGRNFDLVILDPPAFCKSYSDVKNALRGYKDVNVSGLKIVKPGGFLVSSSCSHFVSFGMFEDMLREAAAQSGRTVRVVETRTQAPDHASLLAGDESTYLKFFVLAVD